MRGYPLRGYRGGRRGALGRGSRRGVACGRGRWVLPGAVAALLPWSERGIVHL